MQVREYGKNNKDIIIFLHGGGLSWWNFREEAKILKDKYHIVIPVLNGHADSDSPFTTIEDNAKELIEYINRHFNGSVHAICGLSLGGQILIEMLSQNSQVCSYAIIESALVIPMKLTYKLTEIAVNMSYPLISKSWFSRLQFKALNIRNELYKDYYRDSCKISKSDMIAFLKANSSYVIKENFCKTKVKILILVGSKEQKIMKKSAKILHNTLKDSTIEILNGYTHGEISLNYATEYVEKMEGLFKGNWKLSKDEK